MTTLRLHMPQWQGGNLTEYHLGSRLLSWLRPPAGGPDETVPIPPPDRGDLEIEDGIVAKSALLEQPRAARAAIEKHQPDRILTIGGDCLVDLAPIAFLNKRMAVIWACFGSMRIRTCKRQPSGRVPMLTFLGCCSVKATRTSCARWTNR